MTPTPPQVDARVTVPREEIIAAWLRELSSEANYADKGDGWKLTLKGKIEREKAKQRLSILRSMLSAAPQTHSTDNEARSGLLPCPFCGYGESKVSPWFDDAARRWRVGCGRCGCSTGISPRDDGQQPAIDRWNKRGLSRIPSEEAAEEECAST